MREYIQLYRHLFTVRIVSINWCSTRNDAKRICQMMWRRYKTETYHFISILNPSLWPVLSETNLILSECELTSNPSDVDGECRIVQIDDGIVCSKYKLRANNSYYSMPRDHRIKVSHYRIIWNLQNIASLCKI